MRTLRVRLFAAILGTVALAVGASLAIGILLTRSAVRDSVAEEVSTQADALAVRLRVLPSGVPLADPGEGGPGGPAQPPPPPPAGGPPPGGGIGPPRGSRPRVLTMSRAARVLPSRTVRALRSGRDVDGKASIGGRDEVFSARPVRGVVVLVSRPDALSADDFGDYLKGLLLASLLGALLAAGTAAVLARRLSDPLRRVAAAARELAAGRAPERLPPEDTAEVAALASSFNEMADQLSRAREAERSVLLSVSHELRTPLTAIRGYAEGMEDGAIEPAVAAETIAIEADRLERLVGDLLALAKLEQGVLEVVAEPVDLAGTAGEVGRRLAPQARAAHVALEVDAAGAAPAVADPGRILQVVSNLAENAIRVTPDGGTVTIAATPGTITVSDTGPGIPQEDLSRAFERFHLRRRHGRGSADGAGLGLAIVRDLVEAMGGQVGVESQPEEGTRFTVRLPTGSPAAGG